MASFRASALVVTLGLMTSAATMWGQATPPAQERREELRVEAPPPPFSDGIFPCSNCHADLKPDRTRRELVAMHDDIQLKHDAEHRWCLDCHDAEDRDFLHLANGERVPFEESYRVCGQCHGEKYRDWRAGVHGRRIGSWNGEKSYLLCPHCHNPHQPRFKALQPKPPPTPPRRQHRDPGLQNSPVDDDRRGDRE